jgi:flagellar hook-associated protein 1 FlgK
MSGIGSTLNIAKQALNAQQVGINVSGHNISNVNNEDFSRQDVPHTTTTPTKFGNFYFGTGVQVETVRRTSDQLLENRLMEQRSNLTAFEATESYMQVMESIFTESTDTSLSSLTAEFWSGWHDVADDPLSPASRIAIREKGLRVVDRFQELDENLYQLSIDLDREIDAGISQINQLTTQIAEMNELIVGTGGSSSANDLRDKRNGLVNDLAEFMDIRTNENTDGALTVSTSSGHILVYGVEQSDLKSVEGEVVWEGSANQKIPISDLIQGGKMGGWLEMRDAILPKFRADLDTLAKDFVWSVNYAHSSGAGLGYFNEAITGTYEVDESGLLSTLTYGDRIDYDKDFLMWIEDRTSSETTYSPVEVDMGISTAEVSGWSGTNPDADAARYVFTVEEAGRIAGDISVTELNGAGLGFVQRGASYASALDEAISEQTITVTGGSLGTRTILVSDATGGASRSAASIAEELSEIPGVTAYASDVQVDLGGFSIAELDASNATPGSTSEGDMISFTLHAGGRSEAVSFRVGENDAGTQANYLSALTDAVSAINTANDNTALSISGTGAGLSLTDTAGENIGIADFGYRDNAAVTLGNFANTTAGNTVSFEIADNAANLNGITVNFTKGASAAEDAQNLYAALTGGDTASALTAAGYVFRLDTAADNVVITRHGSDFAVNTIRDNDPTTVGPGNPASADVTVLDGETTLPAIPTVTLTEGGGEDATASAVVQGFRGVTFGGIPVTEGAGEDSAVITGTATVELDPDLSMYSNVSGAGTSGSFGGNYVTTGNWVSGENITFDLAFGDMTQAVSVTPAGAPLTDTIVADAIEAALGIVPPGGSVTLTDPLQGSVTITRNGNDFDFTTTDNMNFGILNFNDPVGNDALLTLTPDRGSHFVSTGLGGTIDLAHGGSEMMDGDGGVFAVTSSTLAKEGKSIVTLGDDGGYSGFQPGDFISLDVDGNLANFIVGPADTTDRDLAKRLETALLGAGLDPSVYTINRNGASVSIMKNDGTAVALKSFRDSNGGGGTSDAAVSVATGTGKGTAEPGITTLRANDVQNDSVDSRLFESEGVISWEKYDENGVFTGETGLIDVGAGDGPYEVEGTLAFGLDTGTLVAGNTFTVNTDTTGSADPLEFSVKGTANSVLDNYKFTVVTGGKIGTDPIEIKWESEIASGTVKIDGVDPGRTPFTPQFIEVDGMRMQLDGGTLRQGDVFTVPTDETGIPRQLDDDAKPTGIALNDWQWTIGSFADQFNK